MYGYVCMRLVGGGAGGRERRRAVGKGKRVATLHCSLHRVGRACILFHSFFLFFFIFIFIFFIIFFGWERGSYVCS